MADEDRALSIPTPGGALVPEWWARAYGPHTMYVTSLDKSKPEDKRALLAALNDDTPGKDEYVNQEMDLVHYLIQPACKEVDGELQEFVRTILFLADGRRVAFGSMGVVKSLMLIQQLERPAPWSPPLRVRLKLGKTSKGFQWPSLIPVAAEPKGKRS